MLKYFSSGERDAFDKTAEKLKKASREAGKERLFYKTWSKQAIFEATIQDYPKALEIAQRILDYAQENGSVYGEYSALHAHASVLLQKQSYVDAEKAFQKAVDFSHRHFPNESAAEDLQELMKIANHRKDNKASVRYARQILVEPNVAPIHKGRALYRLSQMAFNQNDAEEFNRIFMEMMKLKESDGISTLRPLLEVNHCIINGEFEQALRLAQQLNEDEKAERMAIIYHRMGDEEKAFECLMKYKKVNDSITLVSHGNVVANCYVQMNNERLQLEQLLLEHQNHRLRTRIWIIVGAVCFVFLLFVIFKGRKASKRLVNDMKRLKYEKKDAERALEELNELSFYESKTELPLTDSLKVNEMCNRLTTSTQAHCNKGVTVLYLTELSNDFKIKTNSDALKKLLSHLLHYSARFTHHGTIKLECAVSGEFIRFGVTDTSAGIGTPTTKQQFLDMFSERNNEVRYVGMNFYICQSITRLLRGRIWHDTEYTNGTRFCVEIPKIEE